MDERRKLYQRLVVALLTLDMVEQSHADRLVSFADVCGVLAHELLVERRDKGSQPENTHDDATRNRAELRRMTQGSPQWAVPDDRCYCSGDEHGHDPDPSSIFHLNERILDSWRKEAP